MKTDFYELWLENEIKNSRKSFFKAGKQRELDLTLLLQHLQKNKPKLLKKLLENTYDAGNIDFEKLPYILGQTKKGQIVKWTDEHGRDFFFLNKGRNSKGKKDFTCLGNEINFKEYKELSKHLKFVHDDIRKVYERLYRQRKFEQEQNRRRLLGWFLINQRRRKRKLELPTSSTFEKLIIEGIRNGEGSPMGLANAYILLMDSSEQKKLDQMFKSKGLRNESQVRNYINGLKEKALSKTTFIEKTIAKKIPQKSFYSREM